MASLTDFTKLCVHTITTKPWNLDEASGHFADAGIPGITIWRNTLEGKDIASTGRMIRERGLQIVSLCRGGFFPAIDPAIRKAALEDNKRTIDEEPSARSLF